jgi:hypothetical protein
MFKKFALTDKEMLDKIEKLEGIIGYDNELVALLIGNLMWRVTVQLTRRIRNKTK